MPEPSTAIPATTRPATPTTAATAIWRWRRCRFGGRALNATIVRAFSRRFALRSAPTPATTNSQAMLALAPTAHGLRTAFRTVGSPTAGRSQPSGTTSPATPCVQDASGAFISRSAVASAPTTAPVASPATSSHRLLPATSGTTGLTSNALYTSTVPRTTVCRIMRRRCPGVHSCRAR